MKFSQLWGERVFDILTTTLANPTPISNIFGVNGQSTGTVLMDAFEVYNNEVDPKRRESNGKLYKLLLIINSYDLDLLSAAYKSQQK
jgi:hypothetical protein